jgi:hypothetical protein
VTIYVKKTRYQLISCPFQAKGIYKHLYGILLERMEKEIIMNTVIHKPLPDNLNVEEKFIFRDMSYLKF